MTIRSTAALSGLLLLWAASLPGQNRTEDALREARQHYERLEIERAIPLLRNIVSPSWGSDVTLAQRVQAYKYLGAALMLVRERDPAVASFQQALQLDPFTDLDPTQYTPAQVEAFRAARRLTFAIGVRPVAPQHVDPRTQRVKFSLATTQVTALDVRLHRIKADGTAATDSAAATAIVFQSTAEGLREILWDGLVNDGRIAPPGRYELVVAGTGRLVARSDTARVYFDLRHETEALEDTLPDLTDLLPEVAAPNKGTGELLKGLAVGSAAMVIAQGLTSGSLGGGSKTGAGLVTGAALVTGFVAFTQARRHRAIPENIAVNAQRRAQRSDTNSAIRQRNGVRLAAAALVIAPAAGVGP